MEQKNVLIAFLLSVAFIWLWQGYWVKPRMEQAQKYHEQQQAQKKPPAAAVDSPPEELSGLLDRKGILANEGDRRILLKSETLHGSINAQGARFDDITLAGYHLTMDEGSPEVALLSPQGSTSAYFGEFGWLNAGGNVAVPGKDTRWTADKDVIGAHKSVRLSWDNGQGVTFAQSVELDDKAMFTVRQLVTNHSAEPVNLAPYGMLNRIREDGYTIYISHEGFLGVLGGKLVEQTYDDLKDDAYAHPKTRGWLGIGDQYWLTAMIPDASLELDVKAKHYLKDEQHRYQVDYVGNPQTIAPGQTVELTHRFFAGPKKVKWLDGYRDAYNITLFDRAVDYGWLYFLTKPIYFALMYFNGLLGNFGLAILLLTVCVKLLLFPLANKSYKSMAQMKLFMPELMELRERYKDDKVRMNQEMMEFYKKNKVNPAAGCLPILLQIPVFFALYKTLYVTIEMRHAPFYGWIHDLSAPDPTNIFNLFGLLEWTPPGWLPAIGVLPLLFALTMIVQQFLNPAPQDPVQKTIIRWMPFILLILFAGFPAGLVLYWTWSNILSIFQQWVIMHKLNAELHHKTRHVGMKKK